MDFKDAEEAFQAALQGLSEQNWEKCRQALKFYLDHIPPETIAEWEPSELDDEAVLAWYTMLANTQLMADPGNEAARTLFLKTVDRLVEIIPPEARTQLYESARSCFPELFEKVVGYTETGEPCLELSDVAKTLGIGEEEVRSILTDPAIQRHLMKKEKLKPDR